MWAARDCSNVSPDVQKKIKFLQQLLIAIQDSPMSIEALTPKAITLVENIYDVLNSEDNNGAAVLAMAPSLAAVAIVRDLMQEAYAKEHPEPDPHRARSITKTRQPEPNRGLRRRLR